MCDGWIDPTRQSTINFMVYCNGVTMFLKSMEASNVIKDYKFIWSLLMDVIKEVGKENVVQIVTDNDSNFKKAKEKLMKKYNLFWNPYTIHCIDLMLKDMRKIDVVKRVVEKARTVTTLIYNHGYVLTMMREKCEGDIVWLGVTHFATNFIAL